jgi:hypothetical protein
MGNQDMSRFSDIKKTLKAIILTQSLFKLALQYSTKMHAEIGQSPEQQVALPHSPEVPETTEMQ